MTSISLFTIYLAIACAAGLLAASIATALPKIKNYTRQQVNTIVRNHQMSVTLNRIKHQASARHYS